LSTVRSEVPAGATARPTIGVVIRTLNESELIGRCLQTLRSQRGDHQLDILVIDSGSTDQTLAIARGHGVRLLEIAPEDFDYSTTLNLGISEVRGDLILILSAHAVPLDDTWVATMIAPFADAGVAGTASRQVPWPGADFREVHRLAETFGETPRTYTGDGGDAIVFSNAASAVRRSVWRDEPFRLAAAEDLEWARRVVAAGWTVVYEPRASVYHSHHESPRARARRLIDLNRGGTLAIDNRTRRATLREAAAYLYRDLRLIVGLDEPARRKLVHAGNAIRMVRYYVADFHKSGSTAELRRQQAGADAPNIL
jgi:glycosyltransferase involved in cell wall biosynthesis